MAIRIRRREFILTLGGAAAAWPLAARAALASEASGQRGDSKAQRPSMPVVGFLHPGSPAANRYVVAALRQGLAEAGYVEGRNVAIEFRWADNQLARLPALAADLAGLPAAVIVAAGALASPLAAKNATSTIPIVLASGFDPVKRGFVASLNRPGGNVTGLALLVTELQGKRLELLSQMAPQAKTIAYLAGPPNALLFEEETSDIVRAGRVLGCEIVVAEARSSFEFEAPFETFVERGAGAVVVGSFPWFFERRAQILGLAARHKIPATYPSQSFVYEGGLMSYSAGRDVFRQLGFHYVGQILKGVKASDLPVQQPTKFELMINLKTAKALGLEVPPALLARADEVIE
jgi:putative tryptophan/tyrosine transport system substrate-binding protein